MTGDKSYSYAEVYVGIASENVSARLYYAPRYFGLSPGVIYGEINASERLLLFDRTRLVAHGGVLRNNNDEAYGQPTDRYVYDASVGVVFDFDQFSVQLSWVGISSLNTPYPTVTSGSKNGAVLILSFSF